MRKADKQNRKNKPSDLNKINGNRLGTLKLSNEELEESKKVLKIAQKQAKNKKIVRLPQGFCYEFEKMKAEINKRKNKKNKNKDDTRIKNIA